MINNILNNNIVNENNRMYFMLPQTDAGTNQCDGCRRGLPADDMNVHREADGYPYMVCEAELVLKKQKGKL